MEVRELREGEASLKDVMGKMRCSSWIVSRIFMIVFDFDVNFSIMSLKDMIEKLTSKLKTIEKRIYRWIRRGSQSLQTSDWHSEGCLNI